MHRFFQPVSADDAFKQQLATLQEHPEPLQSKQEKRGPGRPRKLVSADSILLAAAAAASPAPEVQEPAKRGKYVNWLGSPHIHDILAAYQRCGHNARRTVEYLNSRFPRLPTESAPRFGELSESTIRSWHDDQGCVIDKYKLRRASLRPRAVQVVPQFSSHILKW